jgi:hypothetical protein
MAYDGATFYTRRPTSYLSHSALRHSRKRAQFNHAVAVYGKHVTLGCIAFGQFARCVDDLIRNLIHALCENKRRPVNLVVDALPALFDDSYVFQIGRMATV